MRGVSVGGRVPAALLALATVLGVAIASLAAFLALDRMFPFPVERLSRLPAQVVLDREGTPLRVFLPPDGIARFPVTRNEVSPEMLRALIESEDRWFYSHPGVNPLAIVRAALTNLRAGRVVSGASTLPMQIARLADPRPRSLRAKCIEAFRAFQLERLFTKDKLLGLYLNMAPFGGNLEGVGAAAWSYFGKGPAELSLGEAALLTALPRAPAAYDPGRHPEAARRARDRVLEALAARGTFPAPEVERARRQPVPAGRRKPAFLAPHIARLALERAPGVHRIQTTIDARTQKAASDLVAGRIRELRQQGIGNAAVVVIENETRALRALVGSADFFDEARSGQVNGATARRSPGSTLKPFLFALAFDEGLVVPDTWLLDVPTDFAGYVPENYDGLYRGRVTARDALVHSLNAPAARLLAGVGVGPFLDLLHRGGLATLDRPAHAYGLPLILGGGEVTLLDLANLYATLAEGGLHRPLRLRDEPPAPAERLLSPEASHLTTTILATLKRPDLPQSWELARGAPAVAWKTGTSYGHRDAWAVGFSRDHTVGVWVGNFDGRGQIGISGSRHAAPLLFDLFRSLEPESSRLPEPHSLRIARTEVCSVSHELPGDFCPARISVPVLPGVSRLRTCTHHRRVFLDRATGARLAGVCLRARPHYEAVITVFPAELTAWWRGDGQPVPESPPFHNACHEVPGAEGPRIVSPEPATPYRLRGDAPVAHQKLRLVARTAAGTDRLYWYQDGVLVVSARPGARVFVPLVAGAHRLVVVDDAGRSHAVDYRVE